VRFEALAGKQRQRTGRETEPEMTDGNEADRYVRQSLFAGMGLQGQMRVIGSRVLVVGCGALGSHIVSTLVRAGVGTMTIVDRDFLELNNLQRQVLFDEDDLARGLPKAVAAAQKCERINSSVKVEPLVGDFNSGNAQSLVEAHDLVMDGTDNFQTRYLINDACVKLGRSWIYGGVVAGYGMSMVIVPGRTPCFRCVFPEPPSPGATPTCDTIGVLEPAVAMVAALQSMEAIKLLCGARDSVRSGLVHIDLWENRFLQMKVGERDPGCATCGRGDYEFLTAKQAWMATSLCGRNAVQVTPAERASVDLVALGGRLGNVGEVTVNAWLLRVKIEPYELTVFADGRTIVKGTSDETLARTLHAKYVGA
jgi:adenylyltransferase/sulfurtransferase